MNTPIPPLLPGTSNLQALSISTDIKMPDEIINNINLIKHINSIGTNAYSFTVYDGVSAELVNPTDVAGTISLTVPANLTARTLCFLNFNNTYDVAPVVLLTAANQRTGSNELGISIQSSTGGFQLSSASTSPNEIVTFSWYYFVVGANNPYQPI